MKFASTLHFNALQEWKDHYLHYDRLKHLIYELETIQALQFRSKASTDGQASSPRDCGGDEESLVERISQRKSRSNEDSGTVVFQDKSGKFFQLIRSELERVSTFYRLKERELTRDLEEVEKQIHIHHHRSSDLTTPEMDSQDRQDGEIKITDDDQNPLLVHAFDFLERGNLTRRLQEIYVNLCSLKDYVVLNYTGFAKILKKYDKVLGTDMKVQWMPVIEEGYFWKHNSDSMDHALLNSLIDRAVEGYARLACSGDLDRSSVELGQHLRDFVVYERSTIWREMVGKERRVTAAGIVRVQGHSVTRPVLIVPIVGTGFRIPIHRSSIFLCICLAMFVIINSLSIFQEQSQNLCFALLLFAALLWATEAIPLFVTSLLVPFMIVVLDILGQVGPDGTRQSIPAKDAAKFIFASMFNNVIMLLLGGFSIAAALSKHHIAKGMATAILSRAGTRSVWILFIIMNFATFASMWISNVAAPVLCFSVMQPILRTLEPGNAFAKSLIMGIALASNVGGLVTPIASPQNTISYGLVDPLISWPAWLSLTLPLAIISNFICWLILLFVYKPYRSTPRVQPIRATREPITFSQIFIISVTFITIALWCVESSVSQTLGSSGVIAILPMVAFFGTGILNKDDFNSFLWTVAFLAMGGTALGEAVKNSHLLDVIAHGLGTMLLRQSVWVSLCAFCSLTLVAATFISHTVSAIIILPIVKEVGRLLPGGHANLLIMGTTMMCSGAMGLSVSGFPNIFAVSIEDATGKPYIGSKDFLKVGMPMSVVVLLLTITLGYGIMLALGM